jgi:tricorn protease
MILLSVLLLEGHAVFHVHSGRSGERMPTMKRMLAAILLGLCAAAIGRAEADKPQLLQQPTLSKAHIAFVYAGDLWIVGRDGGDARRLTTGAGIETHPFFSPDGTQLAFTGEYDGNLDVYVVPAAGGVPRRLTHHPGVDCAVGWTPDGKKVLFHSGRASFSRYNRLFTMPLEGGPAAELPLPMGEQASFAPDAQRLAYVPFWNRRSVPNVYISWKRYRGGLASPIWIANLSDSHIDKVPRKDSNDFNPMWVGKRVYFLSDRNGPISLFAYDTETKEVQPALPNDGPDILSASASGDAIVYEQIGALSLLDLGSGKAKKLDIRVAADLSGVRPRFEKVAQHIQNANISPTGVRAVFEARGEILTVPVAKGDARNLTRTPGAAERDPAWSPNGKWIAYFSDESGEYLLHIRDQRGQEAVKKLRLDDQPSYYYSPLWSPDSKKIAYTDKRLHVCYVDVASGKATRVDTDTYDSPFRALDPAWSPDSNWLTYTKQLKNHLRAVFLYDLKTGKTHQVTDGMSDARHAVFDKNGKYLYFTASTDAGTTSGWLDMSSFNRPVTRSVYLVVLSKDDKSPLLPESDEEKAIESTDVPQGLSAADQEKDKPKEKEPKKEAGKDSKKKEPMTVRIDLENIDQRILALPILARDYVSMEAGKSGMLFLLERPAGGGPRFAGSAGLILHRFDLDKRKSDKWMEGIAGVQLAFNGEKMLYRQVDFRGNRQNQRWFLTSTATPPKPGEGALKLDDVEIQIDPRAEWRQMYREVWRIERDFLYDPGAHGYDLKAAEKKYDRYLDGVGHRADLNYLFNEMLGDLVIGHLYIGGGDTPEVKPIRGGLLGADYTLENGRYRFARVYRGENWNPQLRAPLTQPGVNVKAGEYLLAVNGRNVTAADEIYRFFEGTAGKSVVIRVGPNADGTGARNVTVVPIDSETGLRNMAWIEDNRRKVDKLSGGRLAYLYLPDTSVSGYTNFNRYYFAQVGKEGAVVDERFNGGGTAADYIIDNMRRPLMNLWSTREGEDFTTPLGSIFGPKAMIVNEFAGSGGDAMPWYFRRMKIGPLVGKRTWGGLIGIYDYPPLIDGGRVTAPRLAFWNPEGKWEVENYGVAPDIEVEHDPQAVRQGRDPQLEKAVQVVLDELKRNPLPKPQKPAFPNYHKGDQRSSKAGPSPATTRSGQEKKD